MKLKQDFVTNSSSSSFIVSGSSIKDLTKQMVDIVFNEWKKEGFVKSDNYEENVYKAIDELEQNQAVMIPFTCNYETFISRITDDTMFVDTCNNHDWTGLNIVDYNGESTEDDQDQILFTNICSGEVGTKKELIDLAYKKLLEASKKRSEEGDEQG